MYILLKNTHISSVVLSLFLFILRGYWMIVASDRLQLRFVRIFPHVVDTVLLASAIGLMLTLEQYPFAHGWLTAKIFGLIAYILLGSIALKYGATRKIRITAFAGALLVFAYIVGVALTHSPLPTFL